MQPHPDFLRFFSPYFALVMAALLGNILAAADGEWMPLGNQGTTPASLNGIQAVAAGG